MDFEKTIIEPDYAAMLRKTNYRPQGKGLLEGAERVSTVSLAQMNLLYGDIMAKWVFDALWDQTTKKFRPDNELKEDYQKRAKALFKLENPYLLRNVLMLTLNAINRMTGPGEKFAYAYAIEWSGTSKLTPFAPMTVIFGETIQFKNNWLPKNTTAEDAQQVGCQSATETDGDSKGCVPIPSAVIYDIPIALPAPDEFANREFYYPNALKRMFNTRDRLSTRLADYNLIEWAVSKSENKAADRKRLVQALISATK